MTLLSVDRIGDQRIRSADNIGQGEIDIVFRVRTSSPTDAQTMVMTANNVPSNQGAVTLSIPPAWAPYGPPYVSTAEQNAATMLLGQNQAKCLCIRRKVKQTDNDQTWEVTCTFSARNPLNVPMKVTFHDEITKLAIETDLKGRYIRNSAGDPWSNPAEFETTLLRIHVVKNFEKYDPMQEAKLLAQSAAGTALAASVNALDGAAGIITGLGAAGLLAETVAGTQNVSSCVNDNEFWGFPKGTVRYRPGGGEWINDLDQPAPYFRREYDLIINPSGWALQRLDCGYAGFVTGNLGVTFKTTFTHPGGLRRPALTLLDGKGFALATDSTGKYTGVPVYLSFPIYPERDFGQLGLPNKAPWQS